MRRFEFRIRLRKTATIEVHGRDADDARSRLNLASVVPNMEFGPDDFEILGVEETTGFEGV